MSKREPEPIERFHDAYPRMAKEVRYRPAAPSDGFGNIQLTLNQFDDKKILEQEAWRYAKQFIAEEDDCIFTIGCSNYVTNRAFMWTIEAARQLCSGTEGEPYAAQAIGNGNGRCATRHV